MTRPLSLTGAFLFATTLLSPGAPSGTASPGQGSIAAPEVNPQAKIPSFWEQKYMLGDWNGERTRLENEGVTFDFNDIGDFLVDVTGNENHHATYFGRFRASVDINFNKLSNFDGEFFFSAIYQYGRNLSGDYLHTNTLTSSIAGEESYRIDQAWYQFGLVDDKLKIKLGQVAAVNEFGATDFFDILFNDELGYAPNAIFAPRQPFSPAGKPGVIVWGDLSDLTPGLYVKGGVFTAYDNAYRPDSSGIYYGDDFHHGISSSVEIGYKEQHTVYDGIYKLGANGTPDVHYINPATGESYRGDYNIYAVAEKTVYRPVGSDGKLETKKGLDLLLEFVGAPGDRNAIDYEFTMGGRYTGPFSCRPTDKVGFGLIYSSNGTAYSEANQNATGQSLDGETTLEGDYQYNPTPWLSIQPDVQYIIDPAGNADRQNIVVLGLRTIVTF